MPLDPRIALGVQPMQLQMPDPNQGMNALARMMQIQGMQDERQVNALKLQDMQRTTERKNRLDSLLGGFAGKPEELGSTLLKGGFLDEATKVEKDRRDAATQRITDDAKTVETAHKRIDSWGQAMGFVRQNPTPQNAVAAVQHLVTLGVMPQEMAQQALAAVQNDPQSIAQWATQGFQAALSAKDQLPKYDTRNLGGSTQMTATDPVTGQVRVVNSVQNTQSPDNKASVGAQYAIAQSNRDAASINAQGTRDAAAIKDKRDTEMKLADDYRAQSKNFKDVVDASNRVKAALPSASKSAASTLAAATSFMKLLDPGSVVRESELGMALAATGALDRVMNYYQVLQSGKVLTPSQVKDFNDTTDKILQAAKDGQKKVDQSYRGAAQQYGLRPEMVIQELGQNALPGGFKVLGVEK